MIFKFGGILLWAAVCAGSLASSAKAAIIVEGFDNVAALAGRGWTITNNSDPVGTTAWFQGGDPSGFPAAAGASSSYIAANYNNAADVGTISDWLIAPEFLFANGDSMTFMTRTTDAPLGADAIEVRFSHAANSADVGTSSSSVGDFTTLLLQINPTLSLSGYPEMWTQYTVHLSGFSGQVAGRFAFRYYVPDAGPSGTNSDYIGIDSVAFDVASVPEPGTVAIAAVGLLILWGLRRRALRRQPDLPHFCG